MAIPAELKAQIIYFYRIEKWRMQTIARHLAIHHNSVKRVLTHAGVPANEAVQRRSKIDPFLPFIRDTLATFPTLAASQLYVRVCERGYQGSSDHFRHLIGIQRPQFDAFEWMLAVLQKKIDGEELKRDPKKSDDESVKSAVSKVLHEPPSNYGINRTTWTMALLVKVLGESGRAAGPDVIRTITRAAGYRWRKARVVLTSTDPAYSEKLDRIHSILAGLPSNEAFFSIDEYGPFAVKTYGGRSLVAPGEQPVVPQWQTSRGSLILTAALELSSNQITHFYSAKKNTAEMIKMMGILVEKYRDRRKIYLSWDAASWHISKELGERIDEHNLAVLECGGPVVETAPLPSGAQFLNVIESVFSGMSQAIIHNSDYSTLDAAKAAIDRYFEERNTSFREHPQRAGKKIWGKEREPAAFSDAGNCKDPRYR